MTSSTNLLTLTQITTLESVQVGAPRLHGRPVMDGEVAAGEARRWRTSFFCVPSDQPRWLFTTHLEGNRQADTKIMGVSIRPCCSTPQHTIPSGRWQGR